MFSVDSSGRLPTHYIDDIAQRREGYESTRDFLDIFNHRLIAQYYRIWRKYSYPATYEAGGADNTSQYLLFCLPLLCSALMLGIMIFVGVRANRMYLNHCVRTVQEIKSVSNTETDLSAEYTARGGVNVVVTFCLLACYMILRWIPLFLT